MKRVLPLAVTILALGWLSSGYSQQPQQPPPGGVPKVLIDALMGDLHGKLEEFDKVVKGAKEYDGLFKLYHKEDKLYAEIQPHQFERMLLCPVAIARGMAMGGYTLNFDEQWVLYFKRMGDKVHLVRRNVRFQAKHSAAVAKAVETTYTDSVLLALRIVSINPNRQSVLINLNDIFMSDFAELGYGYFDANRSVWHKVKAFSKNIEL